MLKKKTTLAGTAVNGCVRIDIIHCESKTEPNVLILKMTAISVSTQDKDTCSWPTYTSYSD